MLGLFVYFHSMCFWYGKCKGSSNIRILFIHLWVRLNVKIKLIHPCKSLNGYFNSGDIFHLDPASLFLCLAHLAPGQHVGVQPTPHSLAGNGERTRLDFDFGKT